MGETKFDTVFDDDNDQEPTESEGFSANMSGLNLFDIVQMECFSRSERAIRVTSRHQIGYLFFKRGALTHALTPDARGDAAALQILNWHDGSLEQCTLQPDDGARVEVPWQELLMRAAQMADESRRNVVEFPGPRATSNTPPARPASKAPGRPATASSDQNGVIGAARVHPSGEVLSLRGESADLPGLAAYVTRMADLIGDFFGAGQVKAIDARMLRTRSVVKRESGGALTVVLATTAQSQAEELTPWGGIDWALAEPEVVHLLSGLRDVEGVMGSFLVSPAGAAAGVDLPQVFDPGVVAEASERANRARDSFEAHGDRLCSLELRFGQQRLYLKCVEAGFLGVLIVGQANMPLLSMAISVISRKLVTGTKRTTVASGPTPSEAPRTARSPGTTRPAPQRSQVPGAPAPRAGRSKRPVYFRGRRVSCD